MQIKIYFGDLKPSKQRELCNALAKQRGVKPGWIVSTGWFPSPLAIVVLEDDDYTGQEACERLEEDAQLASENQEDEPEPEPEDIEYPF